MFPVYLRREEDEDPPEDPIAFIVGKNGSFVQKRTPIFRAVVPSPSVPALAQVKEEGEYLLPPIPAELGVQIREFFKRVYADKRAEAILIISYNFTRGTFRLDAPEQVVTSSHCKYEMPVTPPDGFMFVGTVHSHGHMGAFHSGTDTRDEASFDGIHLTFGRLDRPRIDIVASLAVGGRRFPQPVERVLGGCRIEKPAPPKPPEPIAPAQPPSFVTQLFDDPIGAIIDRFAGRRKQKRVGFVPPPPVIVRQPTIWTPPEQEGYVFDLPPGLAPEEAEPDPAWFAQVKERPVTTYQGPPWQHYSQSYHQPHHQAQQPQPAGARIGGYATEEGYYSWMEHELGIDATAAKAADRADEPEPEAVAKGADAAEVSDPDDEHAGDKEFL